MFNITDGNNNISRDKPVEHIDLVIGLHVSACTSCTRTMRVRRDIAIDITESVQLLVRFNALRSMPFMPKLEHYNRGPPALPGTAAALWDGVPTVERQAVCAVLPLISVRKPARASRPADRCAGAARGTL